MEVTNPKIIHYGKKTKAFFARQIWRMRKSSSIVNLLFYSLTLSGIYLPYVSKAVEMNQALLLAILYLVSFFALLGIGILYDIVLKMWKEDNIVEVKRNPYQIDLFTKKELEGMKVNLANFRATYEAMRTNMLICQKLGIDASDLKEKLVDIKEKTDWFEDWIVAGRVTTKEPPKSV